MDNMPVDQNTRYDDEREAEILMLREALEKIAKIPENWDRGYVEKDADLNYALDVAKKALALKRKPELPYGTDLGPSDRDDHPSVKID